MKKISLFIILKIILISSISAQVPLELNDVSLDITYIGKPTTWEFGKTKETDVKHNLIIFKVLLKGFDTDKLIDLNHFSLVDSENKMRYRPFQIDLRFTNRQASRIRIEDYKYEDTFLKYSIEGLENFDQFCRYQLGKNKPRYQHRFEPTIIEGKKKNNRKLTFYFPAKLDHSGIFLIYWKDKVVGKINLNEKG
ncbi:hypothetical protein [Psychroserpens sp. SPM9]|uniref:hypothetical protein n=1 Tax=Psychroserpens sp. SPM9 TaxID=2975598 RepID=UPI0021A74215|nr:hypothetical protein [Psychroserpens sp. SPM9]MDG5493253.1 hypothetical protein [Psychroserpens sp. SPM9]